MTNKQRSVWVVILADGDGARPGVLGANGDCDAAPKQYCPFNGGPSLLQRSLERAASLVPREQIVVVVSRAQRRHWEAQLSGPNAWSAIVQPEHRGTGFSVLLPLLVIARIDPTAMVVVLSSDHYVQDDDVLAVSLHHAAAMEGIDCDKLTVLCTFADAPDPGLGPLAPTADSGVGMRPEASQFEESNRELTARLINASSGWKTGTFTGCLQAVLNLYPRHVPGLLRNLQAIVKNWADPRVPSLKLEQLYAEHPAVDFWHDVLKLQPARVHFLAVPRGWTDLGTAASAVGNHVGAAPGRFLLAPALSGTSAIRLPPTRNPALSIHGARF